MRRVLISGGGTHEARSWADRLDRAGVVSAVVGARSLVSVITAIPPGTVVGYVQLPPVTSPAGALAERFRTVALIAPLLASDAAVVIVPSDASDPVCNPRAREALQLVIEAAAGASAARAHVSVHLGPLSATELRPILQGDAPSGSSGPLADYGSDLAYAEWRNDLLSLTSGVEATYIGWTNGQGRPTVGVLRGAVVSPLATASDAEFAWAECGIGAHCLGEAILADAIGDEPAGDVVERFVKEIIDRLPLDGFELSTADLRAWLRQQP